MHRSLPIHSVSRLPNSSENAEVTVAEHNGENNPTEYDDIELKSLLKAFIKEIGSKNIVTVNHRLARLGELVSPHGSSPLSHSLLKLLAYCADKICCWLGVSNYIVIIYVIWSSLFYLLFNHICLFALIISIQSGQKNNHK